MRTYTAAIQQSEGWWVGWIEEIPGVNSQGETREKLLENLQSALSEMIELNREDALKAMEGSYEEVSLTA